MKPDRRVDGQRQPVETRRLAAGDELGRQPTVLEDVDLEDLGSGKRFGQILQARRPEGREPTGYARSGRSSGNGRLRAGMEHPGEPGRRKHERPGDIPPEDPGRRIQLRDVVEDVRDDFIIVEGVDIPPCADLVVRTPFQILENRSWQASPRQPPQILHIMASAWSVEHCPPAFLRECGPVIGKKDG